LTPCPKLENPPARCAIKLGVQTVASSTAQINAKIEAELEAEIRATISGLGIG
jgi:hypothetical protein